MPRSGRGGGGSRSDDDGPSLGSRLASAASRLFSRRRQRADGGGHGSRSPSPPRGRNNERAEREAREARAREMALERESQAREARAREAVHERERLRYQDQRRYELAHQRQQEEELAAAAAGPASAQQSFQDRLDAIHFNGEIPDRLRCIFTEGVMDDPITLRSGKTYDRVGIMHHAEQRPGDFFLCPLTNMRLPKSDLNDTFTNTDVKEQIESFVADREADFLAQQVLEQEDRSERNERVSRSSLPDDSSSESSRAEIEEGELDRLREARLRRFGGGSGMFRGDVGATHDAAASRRSRSSQHSSDDDSSTRRRRRRSPRE